VDGPVGVDLEPHEHAPDLLDSEAAFCHPEEIIALPRDRAPRASRLLQIWTAKEAILKAIGIGFSHPPEAIRIHFQGASGLAISDSPLPGIENQRLHELNHPALVRHQAVVSAPQSASQIEILG
jgi:phosphopantetheinyl transferase